MADDSSKLPDDLKEFLKELRELLSQREQHFEKVEAFYKKKLEDAAVTSIAAWLAFFLMLVFAVMLGSMAYEASKSLSAELKNPNKKMFDYSWLTDK